MLCTQYAYYWTASICYGFKLSLVAAYVHITDSFFQHDSHNFRSYVFPPCKEVLL